MINPQLFFFNTYLVQEGWLRSIQEQQSIDVNGDPVPWFCYPALDLIKERISAELNVFEWGCGNGSLWWSQRVQFYMAVEHDKAWHDKIKLMLPSHAKLVYKELVYDGEYCRIMTKTFKKFHVVIIDGRDRVHCAQHTIPFLTDDGIIIWDNSERESYSAGREYIKQQGFKELRLTGLVPMLAELGSSTSFFYRQNNCFGL